MARVGRNERTPRRKSAGAHRKRRTRRTAVASTLAASGAAVCIGATSYFGAPTADALSILLPGPPVNGGGSATRINILEGNVFNPQFGIDGNNSSTNLIIGRVALNQAYSFINQLLSIQINLSGTTGRVVTAQVNILSYNVFNPQLSLSGANIANNVRVGNVVAGVGNDSVTDASGAGGLVGGGNGNTVQFSFLSGNIFNPQISLTGTNISNNVTVTNVAMNNGNNSQAISSMADSLGSFVFGAGNGNSHQYGFYVSNISNPQWTLGGGNTSNNSATTNTADGNGNGSTNETTGGALGSTVTETGNGNTTQVAGGSGNIHNDQVNIGPGSGGTGAPGTTTNAPRDLEDVISLVSASTRADARTANTAGRPERTNRQSQQERRESFSFNRFTSRATPTNHGGDNSDAAQDASQTTSAAEPGGVTGGSAGTDDGGGSDNGNGGNEGNGDSAT